MDTETEANVFKMVSNKRAMEILGAWKQEAVGMKRHLEAVEDEVVLLKRAHGMAFHEPRAGNSPSNHSEEWAEGFVEGAETMERVICGRMEAEMAFAEQERLDRKAAGPTFPDDVKIPHHYRPSIWNKIEQRHQRRLHAALTAAGLDVGKIMREHTEKKRRLKQARVVVDDDEAGEAGEPSRM